MLFRSAASPLCNPTAFARKFESALLRAAGMTDDSPASAFDLLKAALGGRPLDGEAIVKARDALAQAVRLDLAAIPGLEALIPVCRDLALLGLRDSPQAPALSDDPPLGEILAHCLVAPAFTLTALPALDKLPPPALAMLAILLLEEPVLWRHDGEPELYAAHAETVLRLARQGLQTQAKDPAAAEAAMLIAATTSLGAAMVSDLPVTGAARQRAGLIELWLAAQGGALDHKFAASKRKRPRLGLFRTRWEPSGESGLALSYLEDLKPDGEIIVYSTQPLGQSEPEERVRALADRVVTLPDGIGEAVAAIRADDLDLLLIGHDVTTHLSLPATLAAFRLARRQAVTAASPAAPGFTRTDLWLGEDAMPPREWIPEGLLPVSLTRAELGVPAGRLLIASAAPMIRLTAELLACWGFILKKQPNAHLLLYPFDQGWTNHPALPLIEARLRAQLDIEPADQSRVTLLPPGVSKAGARAVLALADLYLDAFPWSDPTDLLDPLAVDLPMALYRGAQPRSRRTSEIDRLYDLPALVALSPEDYQMMVLSLLASPGDRAMLRGKAPACRVRLKERGALISWRSFPSRVTTSGNRSGHNLDE